MDARSKWKGCIVIFLFHFKGKKDVPAGLPQSNLLSHLRRTTVPAELLGCRPRSGTCVYSGKVVSVSLIRHLFPCTAQDFTTIGHTRYRWKRILGLFPTNRHEAIREYRDITSHIGSICSNLSASLALHPLCKAGQVYWMWIAQQL